MINRREILGSLGLLSTSAMVSFLPTQAWAQSVSEGKLLEPGPIKEMVLGDEDAPVTIVEYASMTCGHCKNFHINTYPTIKKDYIETGKVRFVMREFPLDNVATAVAMLARCAPEDKFFDVVDLFFETQGTWLRAQNTVGALFDVAKQVGFSQQEFEACLTNQELLNGIQQVKATAANEYKVQSTPTFFINGDMVRGALTVDQMKEEIDSRL